MKQWWQKYFVPLSELSLLSSLTWCWAHRGVLFLCPGLLPPTSFCDTSSLLFVYTGVCTGKDYWDWWMKHSIFLSPPHLFPTALRNPLDLLRPIIHSLLTLSPPKHLCWFLVLTPKHLGMSLLLQQFWIFWFQEWKWCKPFHTHPQRRQISTMSVLLRNPESALIKKKRWSFQSSSRRGKKRNKECNSEMKL